MILIFSRDLGVATSVQAGLVDKGREVEIETDIDATNMRAVRTAVADRRPKAVLHMAFLDDVQACEETPDRAFLHNAESVINLAAATLEFEAIPVVWSPAHVLAGSVARGEDGPPQPSSTWTESRIRGEVFLRRAAPRGLILRSGPVLSAGLATEARRLREGVRCGSAVVQPVLGRWLGQVLDVALKAQMQGVLHAPSAGPAQPEDEIWRRLAGRLGISSSSIEVDPSAGVGSAVLQCDRAAELVGLGPAPDWTEVLSRSEGASPQRHEEEASTAVPKSGEGVPQGLAPPTGSPISVATEPSVWVWNLRPGDASRWTPPTDVRVQAFTGKAFVEMNHDDVVLKGVKQAVLTAGTEVRITVPETTVLVMVAN